LHAVPAPREDRGRNRIVRPAGQDDAEVAGGIPDRTDRAADPHARIAHPHLRLRNGTRNPATDADDIPARPRPARDRTEGRAERALFITGVKYGRSPMIAIKAHPLKPAMVVYVQPENIDELAVKLAELDNILLARTELDQGELISRLERIA